MPRFSWICALCIQCVCSMHALCMHGACGVCVQLVTIAYAWHVHALMTGAMQLVVHEAAVPGGVVGSHVWGRRVSAGSRAAGHRHKPHFGSQALAPTRQGLASWDEGCSPEQAGGPPVRRVAARACSLGHSVMLQRCR